jgi:16S rRNA (guanine527-N7)-methyltransferase
MDKLKAGAEELGLNLSQEQLEQFNIYYRELVDWNRRLNLTSITGYEDVQVRHFLDSLTVAAAVKPDADKNLSVIDVGTGAGLPGLPLRILYPDIRLVLLEATAKKAKFLEHLTARLGLENVEVLAGRAEEVARNAKFRERFGLVLSRAVAPLPTLAELTLPFGAVGGIIFAQKKGDIEAEVEKAGKAIKTLGGRLREVKRIDIEGLRDNRYLIVIDKVSPTPTQYPRRPGVLAKRPIV